ncbi:MAG: caspase family protein [Bacteroides sp.]|nr:caspase family protein [Bacteroides sp.]
MYTRHTPVWKAFFFLGFICCSWSLTAQEKVDDQVETVFQGGHTSPIHKFNISRDGRYMASLEINGRVVVWDLRSGRQVGVVTYPNARHSVGEAIFNPYDSRQLYVSGFLKLKESDLCYVMDWRTNRQIGVIRKGEIPRGLTRYGRLEFDIRRDCTIETYDRFTHRPVMHYKGNLSMLSNACIDASDSLLLVVENNPQLWDLRRLELTARIPYRERLLQDTSIVYINDRVAPVKKHWSKATHLLDSPKLNEEYQKYGYKNYCEGIIDGDRVVLGGFGSEVTVWDLWGNLLSARPVGGFPVFAAVEAGGKLWAGTYNGLFSADADGESPLTLVKEVHDKMFYKLVNTLCALPGGCAVVLGCDGGEVLLVSANAPEQVRRIMKFDHPVMSVRHDRAGRRILASAEHGNLRMYDLQTEKELRLTDPFHSDRMGCCAFINDTLIAAGCGSGYIGLWRVGERESFRQFPVHDAEVTSIVPSQDGRLVFTTSKEGITKVFDATDFTEIVRLIALDNSLEYVAMTPDHYYKASAGSVEGIHFLKGHTTYKYDQFDLRFNRPDIVLERLGYASRRTIELYHRAWQKRLRRAGITEEMLSPEFHTPVVEIRGRDRIPAHVSDSTLTLSVSVRDEKYPVSRLRVWINGVPWQAAEGIRMEVAAGETREVEITVPLLEGSNQVDVSCLNARGAESYKESLTVMCAARLSSSDLYVISVGVSEYADGRYDLQYAGKDAKDMAELFAAIQQTGNEYNQLHLRTLVNEEVTREALLELRTFLSGARPQDVVILFYAGHGIVDAGLDYFLATYDTDFAQPATRALAYEEFERMLDGIVAQRKLILIDACHSGEIDKEDYRLQMAAPVALPHRGQVIFRHVGSVVHADIRTEEINELVGSLFADLRRGIGAHILSSAGATQAAVEGHRWRNGLFTYVVKEGLIDGWADLDGDGCITTTELKTYAGRRVTELSGGWQQPTSRLENRQLEFVLVCGKQKD